LPDSFRRHQRTKIFPGKRYDGKDKTKTEGRYHCRHYFGDNHSLCFGTLHRQWLQPSGYPFAEAKYIIRFTAMQLKEDILFDNRYRLIKMLGCGGFSEVWLVEDTKVGNKKMALKVYAPGRGLDDDGVQLFSSEFELVFDLNHTHLLRPAHFDVCERSPYLLMPFSEQGSTAKFVGKMNEDDAWRFLHDVSAGLAYLHIQDPPIIHQDIKPDNILTDHLGNYQITDFGISAKVRSTLRKSMNHAMSSGTMAYMPPERFGKDNMPIKASDVWALGATVFELITGDLPFGEHGGLVQKSGAEIPNIPGQWSDELRDIISRCLHKEPWDRPVARQITEWTDKHFKKEKIIFEAEPERLNKKLLMKIAGCIAGLLVIFFIIKGFTAKGDKEPVNDFVAEKEITVVDESNIQPLSTLPEIEERADSQMNVEPSTAVETKTVKQPAIAPTVAVIASPPAWIAEYDKIMKTAKTSFDNKDFQTATAAYSQALALAVKNVDKKRQATVKGQIEACEKEIKAEEEAKNAVKQEAEEKENKKKERLASYDFVGKLMLGASYMVVQRKSDYRWGIIDGEGHEVEPATYSQVSARLKNGFYALKNERGWTVFDTSLKKVASDLERLTGYQ